MCAFSHLRVVINSDIIQSLTYYILPSCNSVECFDKKLIDKLQLCVGPLVKSKHGYRFFLTAIDFATSFVFCLSNEVVYTWRNGYELAKIVFFNLLAHLLPSYQGSNILSQILLQIHAICHVWTSPYHPESNIQLERFHSTPKAVLRKNISNYQLV